MALNTINLVASIEQLMKPTSFQFQANPLVNKEIQNGGFKMAAVALNVRISITPTKHTITAIYNTFGVV